MSGNPSPPPAPSNVVPMPTNWPGPMFNPGARPWPQSPSCFSELAGLNACYDSVQMMEQILAKVVCDLAQTNTAFQQCLVNAIAASGSNVPLIGVTNGSDAQPGQVGEFHQFNVNGSYTAAPQTQMISVATLQPGDWTVQAFCNFTGTTGGVFFSIPNSNYPAGLANNMSGFLADPGTISNIQCIGVPSRALISVPTLFAFEIDTNTTNSGSAAAGTFAFFMVARRAR